MATFNAVIRLRTAPNADRQIEAMQRTFAQQSMPFVWWVTDEDSKDDLESKLRGRGFDYDADESIGMAMTLSSQPELTPCGESVSVEQISEERDVRTWFATLLESVEGTVDERTMGLATTVFSSLANDTLSGWHLYLARMSDRPVGTCALHLGSTAGLYSVGTVPTVRRQGVGTALTKRALADARTAGYAIASLTASELGARLYMALGFNEYCRFREYVWRPSSNTDRG
jgi:GNAT superfamily N-acetyltransferase